MANTTSDPTVILVHGACHGPSCWDLLREELDHLNLPSVAVDLPSAGTDLDSLGDLAADAEAVRAAVDRVERPVVVAHSYGGAPVTQSLTDAADVALVVFLAAFMLEVGETIMEAGDDGRDTQWVVADDGRTIHASDPIDLFYNRCPPELARRAVSDLRLQNLLPFTEPVTRASWRETKSAYVICEEDHAIPPDRQTRMATRADIVERLDTDHSPFLSAPRETALLLERLIKEG